MSLNQIYKTSVKISECNQKVELLEQHLNKTYEDFRLLVAQHIFPVCMSAIMKAKGAHNSFTKNVTLAFGLFGLGAAMLQNADELTKGLLVLKENQDKLNNDKYDLCLQLLEDVQKEYLNIEEQNAHKLSVAKQECVEMPNLNATFTAYIESKKLEVSGEASNLTQEVEA